MSYRKEPKEMLSSWSMEGKYKKKLKQKLTSLTFSFLWLTTRSTPKEARNTDLLSPPHMATTLFPANFASCIFKTKGNSDLNTYEICLK